MNTSEINSLAYIILGKSMLDGRKNISYDATE